MKLRLTIEETEETVVKTAILRQKFPVRGKAHLNLRWKDKDGNPRGTKIWLYVVYGLSKSILLSHDFTKRHDEVWAVANTMAHVAEELNITWFNNSSKAQQDAEEDFRKRQAQENQKRAAAEKQARDKELNKVMGKTTSSTSSSTTISNQTISSAGSSTTPTSGSTSNSTNL
jgi:hypothetical protein